LARRISWSKLAQPSTWAGLGLLWFAFAPGAIPFDLVVQAITAIAGILAIVLDEKPSLPTPTD